MSEAASALGAVTGDHAGRERWGWYSVTLNMVVAGINLGVAPASGSLAVKV